jgi:Na+-transporting NADH:ubiquinone oxidoreductase subunit NqrF
VPQLLVKGLASKNLIRCFDWEHLKDVPQETLMDFLRSQKIPIASSCFGEGVCRRCKVSETVLSCQIKVFELFDIDEMKEITIDYL